MNISQLTPTDLHLCVTHLPKDVRVIMKTHNLLVGGGFIRNTISGEKVNDIDLFGPDETTMKLAAMEIIQTRDRTRGQATRLHKTRYARTVLCPPSLPVQFIHRWKYSDLQTLCEEFDFSVCQAAIKFNRDSGIFESCCSAEFYPDLAAKRLVYTSPQRDEEVGGSFLRMRKFLKRGYNIQARSMAGVVARLLTKVNNYNTLFTDEKATRDVIFNLLREVDPLHTVDGLEMIDDHEPINAT